MKSKYIQLPPLPSDTPLESIEMIWLYAKLPEKEQKSLLDLINENYKNDNKNLSETPSYKPTSDSAIEMNPDIIEFNNLMRQMIGTLITQACEMAVLVYQSYCIEKKSIKEISNELNADEDSIRLIARYYEKKTDLK